MILEKGNGPKRKRKTKQITPLVYCPDIIVMCPRKNFSYVPLSPSLFGTILLSPSDVVFHHNPHVHFLCIIANKRVFYLEDNASAHKLALNHAVIINLLTSK